MSDGPICRDADDISKPCEFEGVCHENRRRLQNSFRLRGQACWTFVQLTDKKAELAAASPKNQAAA